MYEAVKEHYFFTLEQKERIESRLNVRVGVFALLGTVMGVYLRNYPFWVLESWWDWWMLITFIPAGVAFIYAFVMVGRVILYAPYYQQIGELQEVVSYREELDGYADEIGESSDFAEQEYRDSMTERYAQAADKNTDVNQSRIGWVYQSGYGLIGAITFLIFCAPPYLVHHHKHNSRKGKTSCQTTETTSRNRASLRSPNLPQTGKLDRIRVLTSVGQ